MIDAEGGHEESGKGKASEGDRARAEVVMTIGEMEIERGSGEEGKHHALCDGAPENEVHRVAEDQEDAGEGDGQKDAADLHPADAVFGIAVMVDFKDAQGIGEDARVGRGGAEDGGVENDDRADEE